MVQESFIQCFHSIKTLKNIKTFDVWFYKIVTRTGWRTVIVLYYFNDMTIKDISKVLGCFEGTVKSRLHNAKKQLRHIIGEDVKVPVIKTNYTEKECVDHGK
ncbi:RNA polymerase sigma factor [Clostridium sp. CS001]|uniref:RNA polymerase sigma factor n=1 Tax=Clostridium sp. CS001 TaxID=2880648 RepID=UPI00299F11E9|nr:sigma factor-like helix-turn-helix DNA-binding protein [Clostridium sp. CS001]